eukprot:GHVP01053789.1.p1 GENE.GHVP01053789.1~~GHVP01053789.1.p1  ORF type:complete len:192 (+),score=32.34 GHVP01053789.1:328-903(+)
MPISPRLNLSVALWDCVHHLCFECPHISKALIKHFDSGGVLPGSEPNTYITPPGPRPQWVCQSQVAPLGWSKHHWNKETGPGHDAKKVGNRLSLAGHFDAAENIGRLENSLELSSKKLIRIFSEEQNHQYSSSPKKDPSYKFMKFFNKRAVGWAGRAPPPDQLLPMPMCKGSSSTRVSQSDLQWLARWMPR